MGRESCFNAPEKQNSRYLEFMHNLPLGIYRTSIEGRFVYCNHALARIFGFGSAKDLANYEVTKLYKHQKDRDALIRTIKKYGFVQDYNVLLNNRDGTEICCALTANPVFGHNGQLKYLDGFVTDTFGKNWQPKQDFFLDKVADLGDFVIILDLEGNWIDSNLSVNKFLGLHKHELLGKSLWDLIVPRYRSLYTLIFADILNTGSEEGILTIMDKKAQEHHVEFHGLLAKINGKPNHVKITARDVTAKIKDQKEQLIKEKFQGVLEMAGGVAHRLNQPLTIINNKLKEIFSSQTPDGRDYHKIQEIHRQIDELNEIAKKIKHIKKYESMDYVAGVKIVDIDRAS